MSRTTIIALAWALVHFVWQGAAIALIAGFAGAAFRSARPATRYAVFCAGLLAMLLAPLVTFFLMLSPPVVPHATDVGTTVATAPAPIVPTSSGPLRAERGWFEWLVGIWMSGVVLLGARSLVGWALAQWLRGFKTSPATASVVRAARSLQERLGLHRTVRVLFTRACDVPATLGWLRPVVLLPISAVTALTPEQIEVLIAHELAHVRRHDYLVNLAQTAVETVLFYHPAVWWVSSRIRAEREHCCDDLAVAACGNVAIYVRALAALEGVRSARPALVVAADGGSLVSRVHRLLSRSAAPAVVAPVWLGAFVPVALVLAAASSPTVPQKASDATLSTSGRAAGFLGGLTEAGYTHLSVDEIIALHDHGVEPRYVKEMLQAGLGVPDVSQLIKLHDHGVEPEFVAGMAMSGLVGDLDFENVVSLRENDARGDDLLRIRALGFGPFTSAEVIRLRQNGVDAATFSALKEAGADRAGVRDAIAFRQNDVTVDRIRDMQKQGFHNLSLEQILKLRRSGII